MKTLQRTIHPEVKVLDSKAGLVEYVASDETVDSYREVIRVSGWRFDLFRKNAPFVNSHRYQSIEDLLGRVEDFRVEKSGRVPALVEVVRWAKSDSPLADLGWRLTEGGFLKAVSVGFWPTKFVSKYDNDPAEYNALLLELGLNGDRAPVRIYTEQQQVELSACILGANPNALAKAYKAEVIKDADLELIEARMNVESEEDNNGDAVESVPTGAGGRRGNIGDAVESVPTKEEEFSESEVNSTETARTADALACAGLARERAGLGLMATIVRIAHGM